MIDESALATLIERHGPMVLSVCRRVLHDLHEAEDVFQAAFLILEGLRAATPTAVLAAGQRRRRGRPATTRKTTTDRSTGA